MNHLRHSALFDASDIGITLIGAGGIGALTGIVLAKMGVGSLILFDGDRVDEVNIATQFHHLDQIGLLKVDAARQKRCAFRRSLVTCSSEDTYNIRTLGLTASRSSHRRMATELLPTPASL
ncbi:MAG: ThiF family adenylyltransferase [Chloroflexi bacterium]|nr:ThiF family adenylyltransferase [Chloroflexota bacterium]